MELYSNSKLINKPDIPYLKNRILGTPSREPYVNYVVVDDGRSYNFLFYRVSFINPFRKRVLLYLIDKEEGKDLITRVVSGKTTYEEFCMETIRGRRPIGSFVMNIRHLSFEEA